MDQYIDNTKFQDVIKTARELFWKHGIKRVSIEEICIEANVSKMTFYKFFPNKKKIAIYIISQIFDETLVKYRTLMAEDIPFEEKVKKQILAKFEGTYEISSEFVKDVYSDKKLGLAEYWNKRAGEFTLEVMNDYKEAQKQGLIRQDLNIDFIMVYNNKVVEMISDPNIAGMYKNTRDLIMEITNLFFYGIFPRNKKTE